MPPFPLWRKGAFVLLSPINVTPSRFPPTAYPAFRRPRREIEISILIGGDSLT